MQNILRFYYRVLLVYIKVFNIFFEQVGHIANYNPQHQNNTSAKKCKLYLLINTTKTSRPRSLSPRRGRSRSRGRSLSRSISRSRSKSPIDIPSRSRSRSPVKLESSKIVIEKLTKNVQEAHIREIFSLYGEITSIDMPMNSIANANRGVAYVIYASPPEAKKAIAHMHEGQLDGSEISVSIVIRRPPAARRGRGGYRGRVGRGGDSYRPRSRSRSPYRRRRRSTSYSSYDSRSSRSYSRGRSYSRSRSPSVTRRRSPSPRRGRSRSPRR